MVDLFWLLFGLILLIGGTRLTVDQAVAVARHYRLSDAFIGIAILALGSDLPELVVSVNASMYQYTGTDTSGMVIGNVLGSSFGQIALCMGLIGLLGKLTLSRHYLYQHGGVLLGALIYLLLAALDGRITRIEGLLLIVAFAIYLAMLYDSERRLKPPELKEPFRHLATWLWLLLGMVLVIGGSELTVRSTVSLAEYWGVNQSFIAIVIIGFGTSLPELSISLTAMVKKRGSMSVGNLLGSNIFDSMVPVGVAATIHPMNVEPGILRFDLPALLVLSIVVLGFFAWRGVRRIEALILVVLYGLYILLKLLSL
jgi:cation:H+ antiporter